jgi:hypothetical protein
MMQAAVRTLVLCGLGILFCQTSASAQYSKRPFGNGNEWYYRSQQAARGEYSKRELHQWMNENMNPNQPGARLKVPQPVIPPHLRHYYGVQPILPRRPVIVPVRPYPYVPAQSPTFGGSMSTRFR